MELFYGVILCMVSIAGGNGMENESPQQHMLADNSNSIAGNNERNRYESITINKPVNRFDYPAPPSDSLAQANLINEDDFERSRQFDDNLIDEVDDSDATSSSASLSSVRCFCNLPACISTGYMCKSSFGGCFSDLYHHSSTQSAYRGLHGCIELLTDKEQRERCQRLPNGNRYPVKHNNANNNNNNVKPSSVHPRSLVHCCHEDMCNHADNPQTKDLINDTTLDGSVTDENRVVGSQMDTGYNDSDVWFKAATIAVPICGAVILFVLIAMAIRLLKTESLNNSNYKLGCTYMQSSHGKHNCNKHHEQHYCRPIAAEPFLRKDVSNMQERGVAMEYPRRSLPTPIILTKNINERSNNAKHNYDYNLLPIKATNPRVHNNTRKCYYDDKNLPLSLSSSASAAVPTSNVVALNVAETYSNNNSFINDRKSDNVDNNNSTMPASMAADEHQQ